VVASEVIEHVPDPERFCSSLAGLTVRGKGMAIVSTINRTPRSYAMTILGAERLLRLLPVGTHDWNKFITPGSSPAPTGYRCLAGEDAHSCAWRVREDVALCRIGLFPRAGWWHPQWSISGLWQTS